MQPEQVSLGSQQIQVPNISSFSLFEEVGSSATTDDSIPMVLQGVVVELSALLSSAVIKVKETADRYAVGDPTRVPVISYPKYIGIILE